MTMKLKVLGVLAASVFLLSACGGGSSDGNTAASGDGGGDSANGGDQQAAFASCLEEQGITLPDGALERPEGAPGGEGFTPPADGERPSFPTDGSRPEGGFPGISIPGVSDEKLQEAFAACREEMPNGGPGGGGGGEALQAYTSCLRDNGVDVPETTPGSTPGSRPESGGPFGSFEDDPNFAAANKKCAALLPTRNASTTTVPS